MNLMFRLDVQVAILAFAVAYPSEPGPSKSAEVARLYMTVDHLRRMNDVIGKNLAIYDERMAKAAKA